MHNQLSIKTTAIATFIASISLLTITSAAKANSDFSSSHTQQNSSSVQQSGNSTSVHRSGRSSTKSSYSSQSNNSTFNISLPKKADTQNTEDPIQQQPEVSQTSNQSNSFGNIFDVEKYIRRQLSN